MKKIVFVLPAYNEGESLPSLLERISLLSISPYQIEIILINDGSTDNTKEIAESHKHHRLYLINCNPNKGLANALTIGLKESLKITNKDDIIITMDADNSHNPSYASELVSILNKGASIVIASRFQENSSIHGLSRFRKLLSFGAYVMFKLFKPIPNVRDYTCGFRGYKRDIVQQGFEYYNTRLIEQKGFSCMAELLLKLSSLNPRPLIKEIPFTLEYDLKKSSSKMNIFKTTHQTMGLLFSSSKPHALHKRT